MTARLEDGWLMVGPYAGADLEPCYIATGRRDPGDWLPAFKGWSGSERILKIRPPAGGGTVRVWTKISGRVEAAGSVRL